MPAGPLIIVCCDSLSPLELSCYGSRISRTPSFDQLAAGGLVCHEHYRTASADQLANFAQHISESAGTSAVDWNANQDGREQLASVLAGDAALVWINVTTTTDGEANRALLETISAALLALIPQPHGFITARQGGMHSVEEEELAPFDSAISTSVTIPNWLPLILFGSVADRTKHSGHYIKLTDDRSLWESLTQAVAAGAEETTANWTFPEEPSDAILLRTDFAVGLRTAEDLLVVPVEEDFSFTEEVPRTASYFVKPEDRFDVNDVITTVPDIALERWQTLCYRQANVS